MRKRAATKMTMIIAKEGLNSWLKFGFVGSLLVAWAWVFVIERRKIPRRMNKWELLVGSFFMLKFVSDEKQRNEKREGFF